MEARTTRSVSINLRLALAALGCAGCGSVALADRTPASAVYSGSPNLQTFAAEVTPSDGYEVREVLLERAGARNTMDRVATSTLWQKTVPVGECDRVLSYDYLVSYSETGDRSPPFTTRRFPETGSFIRTITNQPAGCATVPTVGTHVFSLTSDLDAVDDAPGDGVCRTATGTCSLRAAVMEANALPGLDLIELGARIYRLTLTGDETEDVPNAAVGDLDITDDLVIRRPGQCSYRLADLFVLPGPTDLPANAYEPRSVAGSPVAMIDAQHIDRVLDIYPNEARTTEVQLSCLALRGGLRPGTAVPGEGPQARGSGILNRTTLLLDHVVVADNEQTLNGGLGVGIYNAGQLVATDSALFRNRNDNGPTGKPAGEGFGGSAGGGLFNARTARASFDRCLIALNDAARASGIWNDGDTTRGVQNPVRGGLSVTNSTLAFNVSATGDVREHATLANHGDATISWSTIVDDIQTAIHATGPTTFAAGIIAGMSGGCEYAGEHTSVGSFYAQANCGSPRSIEPIIPSAALSQRLEDTTGFTPTVPIHRPSTDGTPTPLEHGATLGPCPATDQRGIPRPQLGYGSGAARCDAGAYERRPGDFW